MMVLQPASQTLLILTVLPVIYTLKLAPTRVSTSAKLVFREHFLEKHNWSCIRVDNWKQVVSRFEVVIERFKLDVHDVFI